MEYAQIVTVSTEWLVGNALNLATALLALAAGWYLSRFLSRHVRTLLPHTKRVDDTIAPLISELVRYGILVVTIVVVLGQFGVQTASILAVLGAAGLAVALALQGTLSNIAAGVMIIWLRPFNVGEYIDAESVTGTVVEIGLFATRLRTYDGLFVFVPNGRLWNAKIVNFTRERKRMVETKIGIAYDADLARARQELLAVARDPRVLADPAPQVFVDNLGSVSVDLVLRAWVKSADWWQASVDFRERAKLAFDAAGIEVPYGKLDFDLRRTLSPQA